MHHRCIIGEFRDSGLSRGTNILTCCSSLCILEVRGWLFSSVASGMASETIATCMRHSRRPGMIGQHRHSTSCRVMLSMFKSSRTEYYFCLTKMCHKSMYVCMVTHIARAAWINRVRLPILHVVN